MSGGRLPAKVRVLIVEDSLVARAWLQHILAADPDIEVIGTAGDGTEAVELAERLRPDVITMDLHMPKMNGLDATRRIMETDPVPIVMVTGSFVHDEVAGAFRALEAGALTVLEKPRGIGHPRHDADARELVQTVKTMSEVKLVRRRPRSQQTGAAVPAATRVDIDSAGREVRLVAIGASTGGPLALKTILSGLPSAFPAPILIVQHMSAGFIGGFGEWLDQMSGYPVRIAVDGEALLAGHAYIAPDGRHAEVGHGGRIALIEAEAENGHRPSVSRLFRSVAEVLGRNTIGVLLTGMGWDGADGLKLMQQKGAVTIAQDRETSVVFGMPREAIEIGAAAYVLSPAGIAQTLGSLAGRGAMDGARRA